MHEPRDLEDDGVLELIREQLSLWNDADVRVLAARFLTTPPKDREARIQALGEAIVASREGLATINKMRAASMVATVVTQRWRAANVRRWVRDARGCPVPWAPETEHAFVVSYRGTTPSGRSLLRCTSCALPPRDVPGSDRACPGFDMNLATYAIGQAIEGGVVYAPNAAGLPLPEPCTAVACLRCWNFGPWTMVDRTVRQRVCDACFELPFPTSTSSSTATVARARRRP